MWTPRTLITTRMSGRPLPRKAFAGQVCVAPKRRSLQTGHRDPHGIAVPCTMDPPVAAKPLYQRSSVAPQVRPAPNATISTTSPAFSLPFCLASVSASGIDAEDVLP